MYMLGWAHRCPSDFVFAWMESGFFSFPLQLTKLVCYTRVFSCTNVFSCMCISCTNLNVRTCTYSVCTV